MLSTEAKAQVEHTPSPEERTSVSCSSSGTSTKLRDSCHACAISKVKCHKEKPTCSRCKDRGMPCQYVFSKRPGRRRDSKPARRLSSPNTNTNITCSTTPPISADEVSTYIAMPSILSLSTSPSQDQLYTSDHADILSMLEENNVFAGLDELGSGVNSMDFVISAMDSPLGLPMFDSSNIHVSRRKPDTATLLIPAENINLESSSSEQLSIVDPASAPALAETASSLPPEVQPHTTENIGRTCTSGNGTPSCVCLIQALDLLKTLSSAQHSDSTAMAVTDDADAVATSSTDDDATARAMRTENTQSVDVVNNMLACPLSAEDGYLLTVCSMIVLRPQERYAMAAGFQLQERTVQAEGKGAVTSSSTIGSGNKYQMRLLNRTYSLPYANRDRARTAGRLVLGELHRLQGLVNRLSPMRKSGRKE